MPSNLATTLGIVMVDTRFFGASEPRSLAEIAALTGAALVPGGDPAAWINSVAPLSIATVDDVSFLSARKFVGQFEASAAGACLIPENLAGSLDPARNLLLCDNPQQRYCDLARILFPDPPPTGEISPAATIDPSAAIGAATQIAAGAVIGARAVVGPGCAIGANAVIGAHVRIGDDCRIGANVTLSHSLIGSHVTIHPGAAIGQDGFGYLPGPQGLVRIPQLGRVIIGDHVEIGANTTIDRGAGEDTVIGAGTKIDNLVQIGHNCRIGAACIIVAQVGLSGSVTLEDQVILAGQVGVADHIRIGKGAKVAAKSGVARSIPAGASYGGIPAKPVTDWHRETVILKRLRAPDPAKAK